MPDQDNNVSEGLKQIRERSASTLADLEEIRQNADKSISPELDVIRRSSLVILEQVDEIAGKRKKTGSAGS